MRMESDEFDFLAPAYVRGFLRTYARFLRVSEEPLIEEFDRRFGTGRSDTTAIMALENRARSVPRQHRRLSSWSVAAVLAALALVALAVIGIANAPDEEPPRNQEVASQDEPTPEASTEPAETPTTPEPTESEDVIALTDGIELEIVAGSGDCWIDVTADGAVVASEMLYSGESKTFSAEDSMDVLLGLPQSVELVVNGTNIGSPGGTDPITISLPDDIDSITNL